MKSICTALSLIMLTCLVQAAGVTSDTISLEGTIVAPDRSPIVGAYILNTNTEVHTHSTETGNFLLVGTSPDDVIKILHLGYRTQEFKIAALEGNHAQIVLQEANYELSEVLVGQNRANVNIVSRIDLAKAPVNSSQEILRKVPGLFIGQHAGGGKAEQIFLRGFDIDHGTDISISVDGMPVNMVSHAHGQGYADLHFVIPETIEKIDFGKGPYYTDRGNFATAGYVDFRLKEKVDRSFIGLEIGQFNTMRTSTVLDLVSANDHNLYLAGEFLVSDGPFLSPQDFRRTNILAKYTTRLQNLDKLSVLLSRFDSKWDASGQIPVRAVESGIIDRFGAIDDTEGGTTSRTNATIHFDKVLSDHTLIKNRIWYSHYEFLLYSNFTFFLEDPLNGDQIKQQEERDLFGVESEFNYSFPFATGLGLIQGGIGLRNDLSRDNTLAHTLNRSEVLKAIQQGHVDEINSYAYANLELELGKWLINPGLRFDQLKFQYEDGLISEYVVASEQKARVSPKLNFYYNANRHVQLFLKTGMGFHSNDSRIVLDRPDQGYLPKAVGADLGILAKPTKNVLISAAAWILDSDQEFVYVGDAGVVEPSGSSRRMGFDLGLRYQATDWLYLDADLNVTRSRSTEEGEEDNYIPLSAPLTSQGSANFVTGGFTGSLRYRSLADRPANEDYSIIAPGYFVTDASLFYKWNSIQIGLNLENIFNVEWNEAQFATESRLQFEPERVEEIHFTPGSPRFIKALIRYSF